MTRTPVDYRTAAEGAAAVWTEGLTRHFGEVRAVDGVDLEVRAGSVVGLLGPNGAGKTTLVRLLATLERPDAGHARVCGHDVVDRPDEVRRCISIAGQQASVAEALTGRENLLLFSRLRGAGRRAAREETERLLERFELTEAAERVVGGYSGGMRRRLDLAASLVGAPPVLFLDEPTTGLDPRSRRALWDVVRELRADGTTVLLTTQHLEEADELADRVVLIDRGRIVANDTPAQLKGSVGEAVIEVTLAAGGRPREALAALGHGGAPMAATAQGDLVRIPAPEGSSRLPAVVRRLDAAGVAIADVALRHPSLDDVFLALTERREDPATHERSQP